MELQNQPQHISRRTFLRHALTLPLGMAAIGGLAACAGLPGTTNPPIATQSAAEPDLEVKLTAIPKEVAILPGAPTRVWSYQAELIKGDTGAVQSIPDSWLGPIIRANTGQRVRVHFSNQLPEGQPSIIHWHGLVLPDDMDGHPRYSIVPGQAYTYDFEVVNPAATAWFHPHPHGQTATQVYQGLAGLFIVSDAEEQALGLPTGEADIPLVIQDRTFDANNQFVYSASSMAMDGMSGMNGMHAGQNMDTSMNGMMESMMGQLGEHICVNGRLDYIHSVATQPYRLRLLNGSNARIYKLAWSNSQPITVIATDGGLLEQPVTRPYVMLAPGERIEVWVDFRSLALGNEVGLESLAFEGAENPGGSSMDMQNSAPDLGVPMHIATFRIERAVQTEMTLPERLTTRTPLAANAAANSANPRRISMTLNGMQWQLNGRGFEMEAVASAETVRLGAIELWQFRNERNPGAMMDVNGMAHPMHIHGVQFRVVSREVDSDLQAGWESVREGFVDEGWKDTVLVMPGERVTVVTQYERYAGTFVYHCHNLEHGDGGMMRNYRVVG